MNPEDFRDMPPPILSREWKLVVGCSTLFQGSIVQCAGRANNLAANGCKNIKIILADQQN